MSIAIVESGFPCVPRLSACQFTTNRKNAKSVLYQCPEGHEFVLEFSARAFVPPIWECPDCETISIRA